MHEDEEADFKRNLQRRHEEAVAEAEEIRDRYLAQVTAREERQLDLLEQISRQLESIELLIKQRIGRNE